MCFDTACVGVLEVCFSDVDLCELLPESEGQFAGSGVSALDCSSQIVCVHAPSKSVPELQDVELPRLPPKVLPRI